MFNQCKFRNIQIDYFVGEKDLSLKYCLINLPQKKKFLQFS